MAFGASTAASATLCGRLIWRGLDVDRLRNCESAENQGWNADIKLLDRVDVHIVLAAQHDDAFDRGLHARCRHGSR